MNEKTICCVFTVSMSIRFIEGLPNLLKARGYKLAVICADGPEAREGASRQEFDFYPVNMARGIRPAQNLRAWFKVCRILKAINPLLVHGNTPVGGLIAMSAAWLLRIGNRMYTLHGLKYPSQKGIRRAIVKAMEKLTIRLSRKVFSVGQGLLEYAVADRLVKRSHIRVLHHGSANGVDIEKSAAIRKKGRRAFEEELGMPHGIFRFGFFGRVTEEKGILDLMRAVENAWYGGNRFDVIICGPTEFKSEANEALFRVFSANNHTHCYGMVQTPLEYMSCCDCVVLPSYREGFVLVNMEANSVGVPVISTDVSGCRDTIEDGVNGLLFPAGDTEKLTKQILYMLNHPKERMEMGKNGVVRTEALYNRMDILGALIAEYDQMTGRSGPREAAL